MKIANCSVDTSEIARGAGENVGIGAIIRVYGSKASTEDGSVAVGSHDDLLIGLRDRW